MEIKETKVVFEFTLGEIQLLKRDIDDIPNKYVMGNELANFYNLLNGVL